MASTKELRAELVEDINALLGDCLSPRTESTLRWLRVTELSRMKQEIQNAITDGYLIVKGEDE